MEKQVLEDEYSGITVYHPNGAAIQIFPTQEGGFKVISISGPISLTPDSSMEVTIKSKFNKWAIKHNVPK